MEITIKSGCNLAATWFGPCIQTKVRHKIHHNQTKLLEVLLYGVI